MKTHEIAKAYNKIAAKYRDARSSNTGMTYIKGFESDLVRPARILDLGCGTGVPVTKYLVECGHCVHGIDISDKMIELARITVPKATFEVADLTVWSSNNQYDAVTAWDSLFHISADLHKGILQKIYAMLAFDGSFLFSAGGSAGEIQSTMLGEKFFYSSLSPDDYVTILTEIGFTGIKCEVDDPSGDGHVVITSRKPPNQSLEST